MDLASAASPVDVMEMLGLEDIKDRPWHITYVVVALRPPSPAPISRCPHVRGMRRASNALSGEGVDAGVLWLTEQLERAGGK